MSKQRIESNMAVESVPNKAVLPEKPDFSLKTDFGGFVELVRLFCCFQLDVSE